LTLFAGSGNAPGLARMGLYKLKFPAEFSLGARVFAIIQAAGWPIWPLLLASIIAVALIIERLVALRRVKVVPPGLLQRVLGEFQQKGLGDAQIAELEKQSPLGRVLAAGLRNAKSSREIMKESIEEAGRGVSHELERYLNTLGTIASISPLMGLFGTIVGMIEIFGSQAPTGSNPTQLAHGISIALYNTGFGLVIAIPAMIFWRHFRGLVDSLVIDMEMQAIRLVEVIQGAAEEVA
jgi:biopolymer transport protein ExbB